MTDDPFNNKALHVCLRELKTLYEDVTVGDISTSPFYSATFAQALLKVRRRMEEELRATQATTDYDPLALSALQETLREIVVAHGPGLQVELREIGERLRKVTLLTLWTTFVKYYIGNILEWQAVAAGVDEAEGLDSSPEAIQSLRSQVAAPLAEKLCQFVLSQHHDDWLSEDVYINALSIIISEEL